MFDVIEVEMITYILGYLLNNNQLMFIAYFWDARSNTSHANVHALTHTELFTGQMFQI